MTMEYKEVIIFKKTDKEYQYLKWLDKARSQDETRKNINYIYFEDGIGVTTDGHRLHEANFNHVINDGYFKIIKCDKNEIVICEEKDKDLSFPKYKQLFPKFQKVKNIMKNINNTTVHEINIIIAQINRHQFENAAVNINYVKDVLSIDKLFECYVDEKPLSPIVFKTEDLQALIMPLKL